MIITNEEELLGLKKIGRVVALARDEMLKNIKPGITTKELDIIGEDVLSMHGAKSAPKCEYNFPGATCISVNEVVAHGIPGDRIIKVGDKVNIDVSAELDGYYGDTGATVIVESTNEKLLKLNESAESALYKALEVAKAGTKLNQLGKQIYQEARKSGFKVIKNLCGHGIGRSLHEGNYEVLNYYEIGVTTRLEKGLVLAVETFVSTKEEYVVQESDGWTLRTPNNSIVAQFEHTIVITENEPIILTKID